MGKKIKIDKKVIEQLLKNDAAFKKQIEQLGADVNNLEDVVTKLEAASPEKQKEIFQQNYDDFRDKYFYHEPCPEGKVWSWDVNDCIDAGAQPPVQCPEGTHWDAAAGKCMDNESKPPNGGTAEGEDKFGIPFFHKSKPNGFFYEMSDDPKNDEAFEELDEHYTVTNDGTHTVVTMHPDGATSMGVGKYIRTFQDDIGPADMSHADLEKKGYMYKEDDVRDLEYKCVVRIKGLQKGNGFSISSTTGRHSEDTDCRGFAYMFNIEDPSASPTTFRFRKEQWHVHYVNSPEGVWDAKDIIPMALDGADWFGYGFCRYNSQDNKKVYLEAWICPPGKDYKVRENWKLLKRIEDFAGHGWGDQGNKCDGAKDQYGPWSGPQNRLKTNSKGGTIDFKCISFREIDPADVVTQ
jgi:hypothetical protein